MGEKLMTNMVRCKFCGGSPQVTKMRNETYWTESFCLYCPSRNCKRGQPNMVSGHTREDAIANWNSYNKEK